MSFQGNLDEEEEIHSIAKCLGEENVVLLRNRGFIAVGETVEEVLYIAQNLITACETQVHFLIELELKLVQLRAAKAGITNLIQTDEEVARKHHRTRNGVAGLRSPIKPASFQSKTFEIEWEAWMRFLDHQVTERIFINLFIQGITHRPPVQATSVEAKMPIYPIYVCYQRCSHPPSCLFCWSCEFFLILDS